MNRIRKTVLGVVIAAVPITALGAATIGVANAQTPTTTTPAAAADAGGQPTGAHTANGITEAPLTGDTATKVQAAVLADQPGATIDRMETDAEGVTYEAHVTLADGSDATVKLDANFVVTATVQGHG